MSVPNQTSNSRVVVQTGRIAPTPAMQPKVIGAAPAMDALPSVSAIAHRQDLTMLHDRVAIMTQPPLLAAPRGIALPPRRETIRIDWLPTGRSRRARGKAT